jgi:hypothetical protein
MHTHMDVKSTTHTVFARHLMFCCGWSLSNGRAKSHFQLPRTSTAVVRLRLHAYGLLSLPETLMLVNRHRTISCQKATQMSWNFVIVERPVHLQDIMNSNTI